MIEPFLGKGFLRVMFTIIAEVVFTVVGLNDIEQKIKLAGLRENYEEFEEKSCPILTTNEPTIKAGLGFSIPLRLITAF